MKSLWTLLFVFAFVSSKGQYSAEGGTVTTQSISGSSGSWNNSSNAVVDDNVRATNSTSLSGTNYTDYLVITNFGLSVPTSETITGVEFTINKSKSGGTFAYLGDHSVRMLKAGTMVGNDNASALPWFGSDLNYNYGSSSDLWGTTITPADVNKTGFGVAIAAQRYFGFGNMTPRVDNVSVTIHVSATLPVELVYFGADNNENDVTLNWVTNSEIENHFFEIQASRDGFVYQTIGRQEGQGNTSEVTNYTFIDNQVGKGVTYYRLKQVDFDGTTAYSDVEVVDRGQDVDAFTIAPNPTTDGFRMLNMPTGDSQVEIFTANGQLVKTENVTGFSVISTSELKKGWYFVKLTSNQKVSTQKLLIK